jgi:hypothetical protein
MTCQLEVRLTGQTVADRHDFQIAHWGHEPLMIPTPCGVGQPGGLPDISRGSERQRRPPVREHKGIDPGRVAEMSLQLEVKRTIPAPLRGARRLTAGTGGIVALRASQPPAKFRHASGVAPDSQLSLAARFHRKGVANRPAMLPVRSVHQGGCLVFPHPPRRSLKA